MKIYKRKVSILTFLACISLAILFFFNGFEIYHKIMALVFFILAIFALTHKTGVEITKNLKMRRFNSVLGYSFGKWEKLPELKHLAVVRAKQYDYRMTGGFLDQVKSNKIIYQINLIFDNGKYIKLFSTNEAKALLSARSLGKYLDIEILDSRTHNKK